MNLAGQGRPCGRQALERTTTEPFLENETRPSIAREFDGYLRTTDLTVDIVGFGLKLDSKHSLGKLISWHATSVILTSIDLEDYI